MVHLLISVLVLGNEKCVCVCGYNDLTGNRAENLLEPMVESFVNN